MLSGDRGADRRREQKRRTFFLPLIPLGHETKRVRPHLRIERTPSGGLPVGLPTALVPHFAAVEAHTRIVAWAGRRSQPLEIVPKCPLCTQ